MGEYTRRMDLKITLDLWDWTKGSKTDTLDITNDVLNYRFQKSIKTPAGSCQLAMLPQSTDTHILDIVNPMDVLKIFEFGNLKYVGYIHRISYSGSIGKDGNPARQATITAPQFGGLLQTASIGFGMGTALGAPEDELASGAAELYGALRKGVTDGFSYKEILTILVDSFRTYLETLAGGTAANFLTYLQEYLDTTTGLTSTLTPLLPRSFEMYSGTEQTLTFWQVAEQLVQKPFNELWIDNGPRKVFIDGENIELPEKSCFVFRETPFDGTVGGVSDKSFTNMDPIYIDKDHLLKFDLARSMDEVYSVYSVKEAAFKLDDITRILLGLWEVDRARIGKYLFKPLVSELFYTRVEKLDEAAIEDQTSAFQSAGTEAAQTLKAWFENNDNYLSGALTHMIPTDPALDPKIGDKVSIYGIEGFFYVEGIAHTWSYGGSLQSNLTVTRGWNREKRIEMKDRIFRRNRLR